MKITKICNKILKVHVAKLRKQNPNECEQSIKDVWAFRRHEMIMRRQQKRNIQKKTNDACNTTILFSAVCHRPNISDIAMQLMCLTMRLMSLQESFGTFPKAVITLFSFVTTIQAQQTFPALSQLPLYLSLVPVPPAYWTYYCFPAHRMQIIPGYRFVRYLCLLTCYT